MRDSVVRVAGRYRVDSFGLLSIEGLSVPQKNVAKVIAAQVAVSPKRDVMTVTDSDDNVLHFQRLP